MFSTILKSKFAWFVIIYYLILLGWWIKIFFSGSQTNPENYFFGTFYAVLAILGAVNGIMISKVYGGWSSIIGKGIILLGLGIFAQACGQLIWSYYNIVLKVDVPYPSVADIGYFSLIPAYTMGALMFAQASGGKFSLQTSSGKILAFLIPTIALILAYFLFLRDVGFDLSDPIKTFFDVGYPLGEIIPVSIALFTLTLTKSLLGGTMKKRILYLVGAFFFQFLTEYLFLYAAGTETYFNGDWHDLMYATSYVIMSLGLISFRSYE